MWVSIGLGAMVALYVVVMLLKFAFVVGGNFPP